VTSKSHIGNAAFHTGNLTVYNTNAFTTDIQRSSKTDFVVIMNYKFSTQSLVD